MSMPPLKCAAIKLIFTVIGFIMLMGAVLKG
jgi:hypothetical protein